MIDTANPGRVLVVEDDSVVREFCARSLRATGYRAAVADNGRSALEELRRAQYDVLLTDLQMPEVNGIELIREVRRSCADTDVIVLTAYGTFESARETLRLGALDFLTKPVSLDELERTVRRAFELRRVRQEKQRLSEMVALYEISQAFTGILDTATAVHEIVSLLWQRFAPQSLSLSLLHPEEHELELLAQRGAGLDHPPGSRAPVRGNDAQAILRAHLELAGEERIPADSHLISLVLRTHDRPIGMLRLSRGAGQPGFGEAGRTMLAICASHIAASLDNSRLYRQLRDQSLQTVCALAAAIDARDPYTRGHSEQVMRYAVRLAELLGLPARQTEDIRYGALLHDIGKIGIRDYILLKPAPLTDEELAIMQQHPIIGANIVRGVKALRGVIPMIEGHHERIDGMGYPCGTDGDGLTIEARILAIADAYDTMTSDRAYRKGMPPEQAFRILREGRDTHWDGALVDRFIDMIRREGADLLMPRQRPAQAAVDRLFERQQPTSACGW